MIRFTVVFYSLLYGKQVSEWSVSPENCGSVANTIRYLTASGMKHIVSIDMKAV